MLTKDRKYLDIDSDSQIYSRKTLSRHINVDHTKVNGELINVFKTELCVLMTATADVWSAKYRNFMDVTAY